MAAVANLIPADTVPYHSIPDLLHREVRERLRLKAVAGKIVAVKCHFGERGATRFIRPIFVRAIVDAIRDSGGIPFATDTVVLYKSPRKTAVGYLETAYRNGFTPEVVGCPIIIADGLVGNNKQDYKLRFGDFRGELAVAAALSEAEYVVVLSHVTLHGMTGIAGAIKNVGMGCMALSGKAWIHEATKPNIDTKKCTACGNCVSRCAYGALVLKEVIQRLDTRCLGCCHCIGPCLPGALTLIDDQLKEFNRRLVAAYGTYVLNREMLFVNAVVDVTMQCDCASFTHKPKFDDVGFVITDDASVADMASVELLEKQRPLDDEIERLWQYQVVFGEGISVRKEIMWKTTKE